MASSSNGNSNGSSLSLIKLALQLAKGPFGFLIILTGCVYVIARLTPDQFCQFREVIVIFNNPLGWILLMFFLFIGLYHLIFSPIGLYLKQILDAYIKKENDHVQVMSRVADMLEEIRELIQEMITALHEHKDEILKNREIIARLQDTVEDSKEGITRLESHHSQFHTHYDRKKEK